MVNVSVVGEMKKTFAIGRFKTRNHGIEYVGFKLLTRVKFGRLSPLYY